MNIYGRISAASELDGLDEISFVASIEELEMLSNFFKHVAAMYRSGDVVDHYHFSDYVGSDGAHAERGHM